jgi:hypothetical protein
VTAVDISSELAAVVLGASLLFALVCYKVTNLSPGGMIVPGCLTLTALQGVGGLVSVGAATLLTYAAMRLLSRVAILYGKRLFALTLAVSVVVQTGAFLALHTRWPQLWPGDTLGFLVPGLITYQLLKQKRLATLVATVSVTAASSAAAIALLAA